MRIAVIAPPWAPVPPELYGGIETVVDVLARGYAAAGHEILLFTTGDSTCPVPRAWALEYSEGTRIHATEPELRHVMAAYADVQGYDVVHDHTLLGPVYAERYPDLRVLTTVHAPFDEDHRDLYRSIAGRVPLVAISEAQRRTVPDIPIANVIHHGIEAAAYPLGQGDGGYVLFLGRLALDKGASRAIVAARKAGVPLLLAGKMRTNAEFAYFEDRVRPYLSEDVQYLGEVPHAQKLELLAGARALLFPIIWNEPFGMVMVEALACGTPVLASPNGAAPEVVIDRKTGFLCRDEAAMAEAIGRVDELDRSECRAEVEGRFSADRMVRDYLTLFESLV